VKAPSVSPMLIATRSSAGSSIWVVGLWILHLLGAPLLCAVLGILADEVGAQILSVVLSPVRLRSRDLRFLSVGSRSGEPRMIDQERRVPKEDSWLFRRCVFSV
jgi:hypothetical protein